jgi:protein-disulfide isomerase
MRKFLESINAPLAILIAAVMISGSILYAGGSRNASLAGNDQQAAQASPTPTKIANPKTLFGPDDAALGNANAKVTIVEFSDFQCPYCRKFFVDTFAQLKKDYIDTGKVQLIFRNFPLSFHPAAKPAALAAQCAKDQGKFWEYHDAVFEQQQRMEPDPSAVPKTITFGIPELKSWAAKIGLDASQFNSCLDSQKYASKVDADTNAGTAVGVSGTPSFFIDGTLVVGAQPYSQFKALIDAELKR